MVKAVIFDLDDTLYDYDLLNNGAIRNTGMWLCERVNISYDEFEQAFDKGRHATKELMKNCASQHNRIIYFQKTSEFLGLNPVKYSIELYEKYWGYMLDHMKLVPHAEALIKKLNKENIKVAICTDLTTHIQHRKLRKLNIADYIDAFVSSEEAGVEKPDKKIFHMTLSKLCVPASDAIHIGDSYNKDIIGADNAGIFPVWYNPHGKKTVKSPVKKMLEINSMIQLERYIFNG